MAHTCLYSGSHPRGLLGPPCPEGPLPRSLFPGASLPWFTLIHGIYQHCPYFLPLVPFFVASFAVASAPGGQGLSLLSTVSLGPGAVPGTEQIPSFFSFSRMKARRKKGKEKGSEGEKGAPFCFNAVPGIEILLPETFIRSSLLSTRPAKCCLKVSEPPPPDPGAPLRNLLFGSPTPPTPLLSPCTPLSPVAPDTGYASPCACHTTPG